MLYFFVPCISSLLILLVIEKESKIKESLVIIGLKRSSFWISWAITYAIVILISSSIVICAIVHFQMFLFVHWSVIYCSIIIYGLSCCCMSFIFSTFIKKSKTTNVVGVMMVVVFFAFYFLEMNVKKNADALYNFFLYTLSPVSFLSLISCLTNFDDQQLYIYFSDIFQEKHLRNYFGGLTFSLILYLIIAIYLDNVLPQGNNLHKKWHFFITDIFKRKKQNILDPKNDNMHHNNNNDNNPYIQEDPKDMKKAVEIKNIIKTFKVKGEKIEILKNISFNGYYNEIFAILGHNGAGKTTLMNIMTGILTSTQGEVYYDDVPITDNETEICKQFGYCPQFDTFNNSLTVGEHIKLFSGIKNIEVDVDSVLQDIDLLNKKDNFPKELSGGQRKKLCITLALLGSPKYVFLDEPTTGLDPYSRKNI